MNKFTKESPPISVTQEASPFAMLMSERQWLLSMLDSVHMDHKLNQQGIDWVTRIKDIQTALGRNQILMQEIIRISTEPSVPSASEGKDNHRGERSEPSKYVEKVNESVIDILFKRVHDLEETVLKNKQKFEHEEGTWEDFIDDRLNAVEKYLWGGPDFKGVRESIEDVEKKLKEVEDTLTAVKNRQMEHEWRLVPLKDQNAILYGGLKDSTEQRIVEELKQREVEEVAKNCEAALERDMNMFKAEISKGAVQAIRPSEYVEPQQARTVDKVSEPMKPEPEMPKSEGPPAGWTDE